MSYSDPARKGWPFFALFVLVGAGLLVPFGMQAVRDYRIAKVYQRTTCEIIDARCVTSTSRSTLGGRWVESQHSHTEFMWTYEVEGRAYAAEGYDNQDGVMADPQETGNLRKGEKRECWYDPAAPEKSVLVRHFYAKFYLGALIPGLFILVGGVFLRGALRRKPMKADTYISEGERLRFRLSPAISTQGVMGCLGAVILALGLFIVLGLPNISVGGDSASLTGEKAWLYLICLGIEGFLIYRVFRARGSMRVPDPVVEINTNPLLAGQSTELYIRHPGPAKLADLQIQIICEKIGQGGTRVVYKHVVLERAALQIAEAEEFNETFKMPAKASPSGKTVQTATSWCVRIRRRLENNVSYDTDYPFNVVGKGGGDLAGNADERS